MDASATTIRRGYLQSMRIAGAAFLFLCIGIAAHSLAQHAPVIQASGKPQNLYVIDASQPAVFPEQSWRIVAPNPLGPTVAVFTVVPFQNPKDAKSYVDAQLNLRTVSHGASGGWGVFVPEARTASSTGMNTASVVAASQGGNGDVGLTVSFLCHERPYLTDGVYETTVVGTITQAF